MEIKGVGVVGATDWMGLCPSGVELSLGIILSIPMVGGLVLP